MTSAAIEARRSAVALLLGIAVFFGLLAMMASLEGCPINITPPTEDVCGNHPNCGICASEAVCVWCPAGPGTEEGRCLGRSTSSCDFEAVVSMPEACEGSAPPP